MVGFVLVGKDALALGAELSHAVVPGSGIMYIGGYYGPDPVAIDANGSVLWQASSGSDDIYWLESIELTSDGLACVYGNMDEQCNSGTVIYDYNGAVKEIVSPVRALTSSSFLHTAQYSASFFTASSYRLALARSSVWYSNAS